ncbi:hypothetical protein [Leptothoe kymatousa]|uniref:Uncharacterized protein n=1 Tax=Leptothoe kymatousa TAU-MAC 1615 TaxID=2364775 RepID=A0ABS5Y041_9CYAN|nr:hypothetical protein [Leptothoe kymatousa]MBT9311207.1 hypothetical protein [Leptothoe kymatousa TAU-MAC 1615]
MDKRQLKQSAVTDFMQSLEQLNELLGDDIESEALEEEATAPAFGGANPHGAIKPKPQQPQSPQEPETP